MNASTRFCVDFLDEITSGKVEIPKESTAVMIDRMLAAALTLSEQISSPIAEVQEVAVELPGAIADAMQSSNELVRRFEQYQQSTF